MTFLLSIIRHDITAQDIAALGATILISAGAVLWLVGLGG